MIKRIRQNTNTACFSRPMEIQFKRAIRMYSELYGKNMVPSEISNAERSFKVNVKFTLLCPWPIVFLQSQADSRLLMTS